MAEVRSRVWEKGIIYIPLNVALPFSSEGYVVCTIPRGCLLMGAGTYKAIIMRGRHNSRVDYVNVSPRLRRFVMPEEARRKAGFYRGDDLTISDTLEGMLRIEKNSPARI